MAKSIWVAGTELIMAIGSFFENLWMILVEWFQSFYDTWTQSILPTLQKYAREAWVRIDRVTAPLKRAAKQAWRELRRYILKQTLDVLQLPDGHWAYNIITWLIPPEASSRQVTRTSVQVDVPFEELPDDVRAEIIRREEIEQIDVTKTRDQEMELVN
ncbi:MAG TPA: hypothetical protein VN207_01015 [Ktedonobacteraceae bacterium]|nr:hypothetical protein [Ktedonobacteraceae bacterium]